MYAEIKEYVLNNYSSQTTREDRMKIIIKVVSKAWNKTPSASKDGKTEKTELSMNGKEESYSLCGLSNHVLDKCFHYYKLMSMEDNRKIYATKLEEKERKSLKRRRKSERRKERQGRTENTQMHARMRGTTILYTLLCDGSCS
jgi:hypothetical protein